MRDFVNKKSTLYIDLNPSGKGQILRYAHDPDRIKVIADSFGEFLELLVSSGMKFTNWDYYKNL